MSNSFTMTSRLGEHRKIIEVFSSSELTSRQRNGLVKAATKRQVNIIGEIVLNFLEGNLPIEDVSSLKKYREPYLSVSRTNITWERRKELLVKYGKAVHTLFQRLGEFFEDEFGIAEI